MKAAKTMTAKSQRIPLAARRLSGPLTLSEELGKAPDRAAPGGRIARFFGLKAR